METDGEPEVSLSGQDIDPIVLDPSLTRPKTTLKVPGDPWVPLIQKKAAARIFSRFFLPYQPAPRR